MQMSQTSNQCSNTWNDVAAHGASGDVYVAETLSNVVRKVRAPGVLDQLFSAYRWYEQAQRGAEGGSYVNCCFLFGEL